MIQEKTLRDVKAEILRFLERAKALELKMKENPSLLHWGSRETAAVRRASMDLTRILADLRQGR